MMVARRACLVAAEELLSGANTDAEAPAGFAFDIAYSTITKDEIMRGKVTYDKSPATDVSSPHKMCCTRSSYWR